MQHFYNRALIGLGLLLTLSTLTAYVCYQRSYLHLPLLPAAESQLLWRAAISSDATEGGTSTIALKEARSRLRFDFTVAPTGAYPFAGAALHFLGRDGKPTLVDLSQFSAMSLTSRCAPANTLALSIPSFDPQVSVQDNLLTYRPSSAFFSCDARGSRVELDLTRLETPQWWFEMFKLNLSEQAYRLDRVPKIGFGSTVQSRRSIPSSVELSEITLHGRDLRYLYGLAAFLLAAWGAYAIWFFRRHSQALVGDLRNKLVQDRPLIAYQQLSLEPHRDKEKANVLQLIASAYADADLDLDSVVARTGVNRNKINDILKSELGYTFSAYINKLRLTEAARLLADSAGAQVAEIAYTVGYKNVSYFNKLFKQEYNCTPKTFRTICGK